MENAADLRRNDVGKLLAHAGRDATQAVVAGSVEEREAERDRLHLLGREHQRRQVETALYFRI